jgi:hypothetical protein
MLSRALLALGCAMLLAAAAPAWAAERPILVELFTSEGCSSCPPADALLEELAKRRDVLALSMHVDYWDGLGWKDRFSSAALTARQRDYAGLLDIATVYTPQMVVDGRWQAVGSDKAAVGEALAAAARDRAGLAATLSFAAGQAHVAIAANPAASAGKPASVVLIGFDRRASDAVRGGENDGRALSYVDVVRGIARIGEFGGDRADLAVAVPWRAERLAAIVQAADGRVLGIAVADAPSP